MCFYYIDRQLVFVEKAASELDRARGRVFLPVACRIATRYDALLISCRKSVFFLAFVAKFHSHFVHERHTFLRSRCAANRAASCENSPWAQGARADEATSKKVTNCRTNSTASSNLSVGSSFGRNGSTRSAQRTARTVEPYPAARISWRSPEIDSAVSYAHPNRKTWCFWTPYTLRMCRNKCNYIPA